ncbi:lytic transglycosylase domain-containing protein [Aestuariispira ectoiniformans]|uniref:lytic transglycosylase domain-containing protein n=1 Tax=Aestuariispira ectoiniformans TaxID=2775080 RepID=UPI00223C3B32|nr:lytic transglycosylase domain-containing protein [Aestuariispira ectoiniformans]
MDQHFLNKTLKTFRAAFLATALLAVPAGSVAHASDGDTAALPPVGQEPDNLVHDQTPLPTLLSKADADRYARIFDLQKDGKLRAADRLIKQLSDDVLMGHVLFQRYMHPTAYRSKYVELKKWMDKYADHPGAKRIYELAIKRRPHNYKYPKRPRGVDLPDITSEESPETPVIQKRLRPKKPYRSKAQRRAIAKEQRIVRRLVQRGSVTISLERLSKPKYKRLFDKVTYAESLGVIARGYYRYHKDQEALDVVAQAIKTSAKTAEDARWWGGLAAWRAKRYDLAARYFSALADLPYADGNKRAAAAFWAARAYLVGGQPDKVNPALEKAARYRRSFYGLLANHGLGNKPDFNWNGPTLSALESDFLLRIPAAQRAIALIQAGQTSRAETELRRFVGELPPSLSNAMLAFTDAAGLADLAYRLGADLERREGRRLDTAVYPLPGWEPKDGFKLDKALIFAFVRQESRFRPRARSRVGARGLMQLMPATAGYIAGTPFRGKNREKLYDPATNLALGQKYVSYLLGDKISGDNLFTLTAAYNGGPGNLQKWMAKVDYQDDPLLFIESLPSRETRLFIEHVVSNLWIYRSRLGQPTPSMDALLAGYWPSYVNLDDNRFAESGTNVTN